MCLHEHIDHGTVDGIKRTTPMRLSLMTATRGTKDMLHESNSSHEKVEPLIYQIKIKGHLDRKWADWFAGLSITSQDSGETLLTGPVLDQAMLYGLLRKVRDVGLPLVAVMQVEPEQADGPDVNP
jgi:hypothetical protein